MKLICSLLLTTFIIKSKSIINNDNSDINLDIDITEAPFALSLRQNDSHICGATIISSNWGITAAHCVTLPISSANYSVRGGSSYRTRGGSIHKLVKTVSHPQYNPDYSDYDIGLFIVEPEFQFNNSTQPITLPALDGDNINNKTSWGFAVGWGAFMIDNEDLLSDTLRRAKLPEINWNDCEKIHSEYLKITPQQVCYGYQNGSQDTCKGDSGGPLFTESKVFIGITSWGDDCGQTNSPGVYTNIILLRDWIKNITGI